MKLLIIILLFPFVCNAQGGNIEFDTTHHYPIYTITRPTWFITQKPIKPTLKVFDEKKELVAEVDTLKHLKVYGDTLSVLKAILKSYNIEIKP